jgi:hypothetical protein
MSPPTPLLRSAEMLTWSFISYQAQSCSFENYLTGGKCYVFKKENSKPGMKPTSCLENFCFCGMSHSSSILALIYGSICTLAEARQAGTQITFPLRQSNHRLSYKNEDKSSKAVISPQLTQATLKPHTAVCWLPGQGPEWTRGREPGQRALRGSL